MNLIPESKLDKSLLLFAWIIFPAGVLWEYLDWFEWLRTHSAGPLITLLTIWGISLQLRGESSQKKRVHILLCTIVFILGILAEVIGVASGLVFGDYLYGDILGPTIGGVPIAIGSAWVMMTLFSLASFNSLSVWIRLFAAAVMATLFDALMEPAAVQLGYWEWANGHIPFQNYFAWFVLALVFSVLLSYSPLSRKNPSWMLTHILFIQVVYFILVLTVL